jgi:chromosome segregation ATPase
LDEIKSKDDTITTLNEQLTARNDTIEAHEGTISELTDENENLTTAKNDLKDKLEKEVARTKELESRLTTLSEQFLKPEREKVKHELTNFFQEMDINSEDIGK